MSRFLIMTWDGAGNLAPTLGIARTLVERGHDVRLMGHRTIAERCGDVGTRFVPLSQGELWDAMDDPGDFEAEIRLLINELCFSSTIAGDLAKELDREPADAVLVDCMLFTAIDVALASGSPTATLFHTAYTVFRGGPLVEMFAPGMEIANARRAELGLPAIERLGDIHDACACAIVALPKEFEPDVPDAGNVLRIGPVLDAPPLCCEVDEVDLQTGSTPLVLVSLSTSEQGQADLLQRCADAVAQLPVNAIVTTGPSIDPASVTAGANTQVARYVPHAEILPLGVTGDHPCRPRHHDGRARPRCAAAVHADRPRPVLQRRAGPDPRGRPDADAGRRQRCDRTRREGHSRGQPLHRGGEADGRRDRRLRRRGTGRYSARNPRVTSRIAA